jgi:hypothetical protein
VKKILFLIPIVLIIAAGVFVATHKEKLQMDSRFGTDCISNPNPVFTHYPTDIDKVRLLMPPLMTVASGMKGHSYIDVTERVPVYAPADATLVEGTKYREDLGGRGEWDQYTFSLVVSCEVFYFFDHVIDPPEKIANAFAGEAAATTHSISIDPIEIKGGEFLGYSAGTGQHNFDFGVINMSQETILAGDSQYNHSEKYRNADCPYKYFDQEKRKVLFDLIGYSNASDLTVIDNLCE